MKDQDQAEMIKAIQHLDIPPQQKALYLYGKFVERHHLYDKAFFGHKASRAERKKIAALWKRAMKLAGVMDGQPEANDTSPVSRSIPDQTTGGSVNPGSEEAEPTA